ncbi:PAS-domain containing protein [Denitromonas iodatirespirans]|uniref:histidine kinase n=1 Tax=Denitromonas iodatirespirans TaxID=2795389 RepID=A0A944D6W7_DENI1|nr:PAS-domain containing protein [Denitromonas iodatirespirans]MBT0961049.1 PAS-domain containing protein [Denitromonas iodatirespirans]
MPRNPFAAPTPPQRSSESPEQLRRYDLLLAGLDLLDQAIAVFDATPKLVTWNKAMVRLLDFPESFVRVGTPFEAFVRFNAERGEYGEGNIEKQVAERMASVRAFQPHYAERVRPNGKVLAIRGVPIPNLGFVSLWTDITEQRRYETLIQQQNVLLEARVRERTAELLSAKTEIDQIAQALGRSEARLQMIIDSIPALIAYVDRQRNYQFANKGYAEWFGLTKENIVGRSIRSVFGDEAYAQITGYLDTASAGERVTYEYARKTDKGRTVYARSVVVPEFGEGGTVVGFFVLSIDITEQRASEAALVQAQKMEAVGQLTGGLAHDFNNLLTIIMGNLEAARERCDPALATDYLNPALHAAQRGAELIRRLLTFSRRQTLEPCAVEVGQLVHNMTQLLSRSLTESVRIQTHLPEAPLYAMADPHQLESALLNLAINARDAMPGGGALTIRVHERHIPSSLAMLIELPVGDYVQIDVEDTGSGIAPELLPRVFEPFVTTKPFGRGSGLGLSMVYGFVRQSGGNIRVRSTLGKGSTVTFVLPRTEAPAPVADEVREKAADTATPRPAVLLVEDEPEVRKIIRMQLTELGYPVLETDNGEAACEMLQHIPDIGLLVSDTVMPGAIGGKELVQFARDTRPDLPVLLITGYASGNAINEVQELDVPVLRKPFDRQLLDRTLTQLLQDTDA